MPAKYFPVFLLFIFKSVFLFSQTDDTLKSEIKINKAYIKSYLTDSRDILASPFQMNKKQLMKASVFAAAAGSLILFADKPIHDFALNNYSPTINNIAKYGLEPWGDGPYSMSAMAAFYLYGTFGKNDRAKKIAMLGVKTFIITGIINYIPKEFIHRERPYVKGDPHIFLGPLHGYGTDEKHSLPSGHSMSAFAMATIISSEFNEYKIVPIVSYSIATLTALSRVYQNRHWFSDICVGSVLGYSMAKIIYNHNNWGVKISPVIGKNSSGVYIQIPLNKI